VKRASCPTSQSPGQRDRLLELLRVRGGAGVTNTELNSLVGFRYGARLFELRRMGHVITTEREAGEESVFRFKLVREASEPLLLSDYDARTRRLEAEAAPVFAGVEP
jgi:hypothetical protein